jgi:hypothetical protein
MSRQLPLHLNPMRARFKRIPPIVFAGLAQGGALLACVLLLVTLLQWDMRLSLATLLMLESTCAVVISYFFRLPSWWLLIQAVFAPGVYWVGILGLAPQWYLAAFIFLVLIYWSTYTTQVPLYLSRRGVWQQVSQLLLPQPGLRFVDMGSGLGGLVHFLARAHSGSHFSGIESAPLPYCFGKLRTLFQDNADFHWGDLWRRDLSGYDVVFAYLSPVPMPALWEKAQREMRPGSLFISYRFAVPGVAPSAVIEMRDLGRTQLYLWRL